MPALLSPGQDIVLSWSSGAVDCRVVAAAGGFVLLRPERVNAMSFGIPQGTASLTYLDGLVPMGLDGSVEDASGAGVGELRFRVEGNGAAADRRSSVRLPVSLDLEVVVDGKSLKCQLLDVSAGGARFRTPSRIPLGALLHIVIELGEGVVVDADAVVRSSEPSIAAVEFTAMHGATPQEIGAWTVARLRASLAGSG